MLMQSLFRHSVSPGTSFEVLVHHLHILYLLFLDQCYFFPVKDALKFCLGNRLLAHTMWTLQGEIQRVDSIEDCILDAVLMIEIVTIFKPNKLTRILGE